MIIYKTTNLINGKIYIGQDSKDRTLEEYPGSGKILKQAIDKYGIKNFKKETIEICNTKEELNEKEIYWIKEYKSRDKNIGYNLAAGGFGGIGGNTFDLMTEDGKKERCRKISEKAKQNYQEGKTGIYASHPGKNKGGTITDEQKKEISNRNRGMIAWNKDKKMNPDWYKHRYKKVYQYDFNGNLIQEYESLSTASKITNIGLNRICYACQGVYKSAGNYIWSYIKLDIPIIRDRPRNKKRIILQFDKDGRFIKEYESITLAANEMYISGSLLTLCCQGKRKSAAGYIWKYKEEKI